MRRIASVLAFALVFIGHASAHAATDCNGNLFLPPVDVIVCSDPDLFMLDREISALYSSAYGVQTGPKRGELVREQQAWMNNRAEACRIPPVELGVSVQQALSARPCLINNHRDRVKKLASSHGARVERLNAKPARLTPQNAYFAIVTRWATFLGASEDLDRLSIEFPYETFALFPPYGDSLPWVVVFASYTDEKRAGDARDVVRALGISNGPTLWRIPDPLATATAWVPLEVKRAADSPPVASPPRTAAHPPNEAESPEVARNAAKVLSCYKGAAAGDKQVTIRQMFECSGFWVTPRALLTCGLETHCPVLSDTVEGRATLDATLAAQKLSRDTVLTLREADLPPMPSAAKINECRGKSHSEDDLVNCVLPTIPSDAYKKLQECFEKAAESDRLACFSELVNVPNFTALLGCAGGGAPSPDKVLSCSPNPMVKLDAEKMRQCIASAAGSDAARRCLSSLNDGQRAVADCVSKLTQGADAASCLDGLSPDVAKARGLVGCLTAGNNSALSCGADAVGGNTKQIANCLTTSRDAVTRAACLSPLYPNVSQVQTLADCVAGHKQNDALVTCSTAILGGNASQFAACIDAPASRLDGCLANIDPKLGQASKALECLRSAQGGQQAFGCVAPQLGGDTAKVAGCVTKPDQAAVAFCLLGDKPEVKTAERVYKCVSEKMDAASLMANCTEGLFDQKTGQTLACISRSGNDQSQLVGCAAGAVLPPDAARLVGCATNSQGPTSFALCAAAPAMNEEWRIAAECAVESGGNPVGFAGCTAGRLTARELTKCFTGQVGKDCFGPNNTVVKTLTNAFNDLTQGPGKNNEVVKALNAIGELTGGSDSVINNPRQLLGGSNSMINNPSQIWGGPSSVFNQAAGGDNSEVRKVLRGFDPSTWRF
jgi:uncharacterized protein YecT (DUF1311 family)